MASIINTVTTSNLAATTKSCSHYKRKCNIVAPCCKEIFPCRFCHDAKYVDDWRLNPEEMHPLKRKEVKEIICCECQTKQNSSNKCTTCGISFALYHCSICNLYDDDGIIKEAFHCDGCGICRVGGRNNYSHCYSCNMCISINDTNHSCRGDLGACPICMEDLQTSRESTLWLSCLHAIHHKCYLELSKTSLKCPVCSKSFVEKSNLVDFNERIDAEIAATPMPEEYANMMVKILCNDCNNESEVKFHIFGLKCLSGECGSYNTRRI
jgi:RING finger/CHY zinc finger protein 1